MTAKAAKHLAGALELVELATKEIRTMSYLLHPPLLEEMGLAGALEWYAQGLAERSGLKIELDVLDDVGRLGFEIELVIFRIVQECLTNVHRHSGSKSAAIRLKRRMGMSRSRLRTQAKGCPSRNWQRFGTARAWGCEECESESGSSMGRSTSHRMTQVPRSR